ncbi:MAG: SusD/RagB family nutrient-binding outer membrane lipoprotein, partial [Bacteroidia bacterium]
MKQEIYLTAILWLALVLASGCDMLGDFGDTNVNPATTLNPPTSALLTKVLSGIGKYSDSYPDFENRSALYCQYFSETYSNNNSRYAPNAISPMAFYSGELYDLQNIIEINSNEDTKDKAAEDGANDNQIAIARILKAYIFWTITDRWG